jgi:3-oxoacyl-ACP reductase-like protein
MHGDLIKTFDLKEEDMSNKPLAQTQKTQTPAPAAAAPAPSAPKTREELLKDLQKLATTLMLEHNVLAIQISQSGIQVSVMQSIDLPLG